MIQEGKDEQLHKKIQEQRKLIQQINKVLNLLVDKTTKGEAPVKYPPLTTQKQLQLMNAQIKANIQIEATDGEMLEKMKSREIQLADESYIVGLDEQINKIKTQLQPAIKQAHQKWLETHKLDNVLVMRKFHPQQPFAGVRKLLLAYRGKVKQLEDKEAIISEELKEASKRQTDMEIKYHSILEQITQDPALAYLRPKQQSLQAHYLQLQEQKKLSAARIESLYTCLQAREKSIIDSITHIRKCLTNTSNKLLLLQQQLANTQSSTEALIKQHQVTPKHLSKLCYRWERSSKLPSIYEKRNNSHDYRHRSIDI